MPGITPCLWFDHQADEAMAFYTSIFDDSSIGHIERYPDESLDPHFAGMHGKVIMGSFELAGQSFLCLDGGPQFRINPAISFYCVFDDPAAIESAWQRLRADGKVLMEFQAYPWAPAYGWLQDRYGVSWQLALTAGDRPPQRITPMLMFTGPAAGRAEQAVAELCGRLRRLRHRRARRVRGGGRRHARAGQARAVPPGRQPFHGHGQHAAA